MVGTAHRVEPVDGARHDICEIMEAEGISASDALRIANRIIDDLGLEEVLNFCETYM